MKSFRIRNLLSLVGLFAVLTATIPVRAGSVPMSDVVQQVSAAPGQSGAMKLYTGDDKTGSDQTGDDTAKAGQPVPAATPPGTRVYTVEEVDVVKDEDCNCVQPEPNKKHFPYWVFLGLAVVPFAFCCRDKDHTPTPPNMTPTPPMTVTPTPPETPPNTPPNTPVPEPMTLLLFGTGLAGVGLAARKRFRKNETGDDKTEIQ